MNKKPNMRKNANVSPANSMSGAVARLMDNPFVRCGGDTRTVRERAGRATFTATYVDWFGTQHVVTTTSKAAFLRAKKELDMFRSESNNIRALVEAFPRHWGKLKAADRVTLKKLLRQRFNLKPSVVEYILNHY